MEGSRGLTIVYRSLWKVTKGKKVEVALKMLKTEYSDRFLKEFIDTARQYAFLQSNAIVKFYGITLTSNISFVLEHFRLGPLDQYLRRNKSLLKTVDLLEAASNVATALWHLKENNIIHGNIRCRKLMVNTHDENSFTVKLTDPGVNLSYPFKEIHWIPVECYSNFEFAKRSTPADVWAFATTLWEIFMFGEEIRTSDHLEAMRCYISGKRFSQPPSCPDEIYQLMNECWDMDPYRRKQPQAVMRDINQILYQVYNSRRIHSYAKVKPLPSSESVVSSSGNSITSTIPSPSDAISNATSVTYSTFVPYSDMSESGQTNSDLIPLKPLSNQFWIASAEELGNREDASSCDFSNMLSNFDFSTASTSLNSINSMQAIFELDASSNVVINKRIGQGFYGQVYKGTMDFPYGLEPRDVAVKKLKASSLSSCQKDFEREIDIMKGLQHPNIVQILGVLREPEIALVMEYVEGGSLQSYLKTHQDRLRHKQLLNYALDIAKGMDYLGMKNIVHRDLAARNILVTEDANHVKISDFGLAQVIGTNDYYILQTNRELPVKWYAPESLRNGKFSVRSDMWSFGVTMCEMFNYGEEPSLESLKNKKIEGQEQQVLMDALENGERFPNPPGCPWAIYMRLIRPCWEGPPHARPTFAHLIGEIHDVLREYVEERF